MEQFSCMKAIVSDFPNLRKRFHSFLSQNHINNIHLIGTNQRQCSFRGKQLIDILHFNLCRIKYTIIWQTVDILANRLVYRYPMFNRVEYSVTIATIMANSNALTKCFWPIHHDGQMTDVTNGCAKSNYL